MVKIHPSALFPPHFTREKGRVSCRREFWSFFKKKPFEFPKITTKSIPPGQRSNHVHNFSIQTLKIIFISTQIRKNSIILSYLQNPPSHFFVCPLPQPQTLAPLTLLPGALFLPLPLPAIASPPFFPLRRLPPLLLPAGAPPALRRRHRHRRHQLPQDPDPARGVARRERR